MSIADKITSITGHLEDDYTALEQLGVSVEDRNIENIKDMANQIYAKFPKTDYAEGSNITLSNTLKGKLDFEDGIVGYGQTSQTQYNGYNILPNYRPNTQTIGGITQTKNSNGTIILNGTASAYILFVDSNSITLEAGTYSLYIKTDNYSNYVTGQLRSTDGQTTYTTTGTKSTFTLTETTEVTYRTVIISGAILTNYELKPMVYSGTSTKEFEPYVGGIPSPSPSYPQDIEVVRGKNRLNPNNVIHAVYSGSVGSTGNLTAYSNSFTTWIEMTKNETYVFSGDLSNVTSNVVRTFVTNTIPAVGTSVTRIDNLTSGSTYTNANGYKYLVLEFLDVSTYQGNWQLEQGSTATSYLPYNTLEVVERGKNWLPNNSTTQTVNGITYTINEDKSITISGTATARADIYLFGGSTDTGNYLHIPKGTYVLNDRNKLTNGSLFLAFREKTAGTKYETTTSDTAMELLANQDCYFYGVMLAVENGVTLNQMTFYPMVSNETTTYEPYQTPQTYQLSLGEYEFARIGNYVDTIEYDVDEDKVYENEKVKKITITSEMVTQIIESADYGNYIVINPNASIDMTSTTNNVMCNIAIPTSYDNRLQNVNNYRIFTNVSGNTIILRLPVGSSIDTLEEAKQLITNTNMYVIVKLVTPTKTEITTTLKDQIKALYYSHSFTGTTIIEINGQLPLIIKVRALKGE